MLGLPSEGSVRGARVDAELAVVQYCLLELELGGRTSTEQLAVALAWASFSVDPDIPFVAFRCCTNLSNSNVRSRHADLGSVLVVLE